MINIFNELVNLTIITNKQFENYEDIKDKAPVNKNCKTADSFIRAEVKTILRCIIIVIVAGLVGFALLTLAYFIPTDGSIRSNLEKSSEVFKHESDFQPVANSKLQLDNYTDALMLLEAGAPRVGDAPQDAANNYYNTIAGTIHGDVFKQIYSDQGSHNTGDLKSYSRYWHGYLTILKPLLLLFDYGWIRVLIAGLQLALVFACIICLTRQKKEHVATALAATYICISPIPLLMNMQLSCCITITLLGVLTIILLRKKIESNQSLAPMLFCIFGCATSYFDLLTIPLVTCAGMLLIYLEVVETNRKHVILHLLKICFYWCLGYFMMWALKWCIGSIVTGTDIFSAALQTATERTSNSTYGEEAGTIEIPSNRLLAFAQTIYFQCGYLINPVLIIIVAIFIIFAIACIIKSKRILIKECAGLIVVGVFPFIWYFLLLNHSYVHARYTYRLLAITILAFFLFCARQNKGIVWKQAELDKNNN